MLHMVYGVSQDGIRMATFSSKCLAHYSVAEPHLGDLFLADRLQPDDKFLFANVHCRQDFRRGLLLFIVGFKPTLSNVSNTKSSLVSLIN